MTSLRYHRKQGQKGLHLAAMLAWQKQWSAQCKALSRRGQQISICRNFTQSYKDHTHGLSKKKVNCVDSKARQHRRPAADGGKNLQIAQRCSTRANAPKARVLCNGLTRTGHEQRLDCWHTPMLRYEERDTQRNSATSATRESIHGTAFCGKQSFSRL